MLEVVQEEDKVKCSKDLDYIKLSLSNLRIGHSQLMLDLPLDYHSEDFDNSFMSVVDELEDLVKDYEERILWVKLIIASLEKDFANGVGIV